MRSSPTWRRDQQRNVSSNRRGAETALWRRDDLRSRRRDAQHRETALIGAVGAEEEQPVDAGIPGGVGQCLRREPLWALGLHQRGDQRDRVIGERRGAHRVLLVAGAITLREVAV